MDAAAVPANLHLAGAQTPGSRLALIAGCDGHPPRIAGPNDFDDPMSTMRWFSTVPHARRAALWATRACDRLASRWSRASRRWSRVTLVVAHHGDRAVTLLRITLVTLLRITLVAAADHVGRVAADRVGVAADRWSLLRIALVALLRIVGRVAAIALVALLGGGGSARGG
jgi:hypothetical protein